MGSYAANVSDYTFTTRATAKLEARFLTLALADAEANAKSLKSGKKVVEVVTSPHLHGLANAIHVGRRAVNRIHSNRIMLRNVMNDLRHGVDLVVAQNILNGNDTTAMNLIPGGLPTEPSCPVGPEIAAFVKAERKKSAAKKAPSGKKPRKSGSIDPKDIS